MKPKARPEQGQAPQDIPLLAAVAALDSAVAQGDAEAIVAACLHLRATAVSGQGAQAALRAVHLALAQLDRSGPPVADPRQGYRAQGAGA